MIIIVKIHHSPSGMENLNSRHRNRAYGAYDLNSSSNLPQMSTLNKNVVKPVEYFWEND